MHVLTKIFIVLVSLLAVLLVPLVVVYSHNENSYKARFQEAELSTATARMARDAVEATAGAEQTRLNAMIEELRRERTQLQNEKTAADVAVRQLESRLAASDVTQATIVGDIQLIKTTAQAGQQLTESLIGELRDLRAVAVATEREKVELDEALRDVSSQLEVAEQARRALAEELARLKDEHSQALTDLGKAIAMGFNPGAADRASVRTGIMPDRTLRANVVRVERSSGQVLAEIDAGARDGVKEGWSMTISGPNGFVANLRIINVDINRSTGVVTLEDSKRGLVQVNHIAHAIAGQN